MSRQIVLTVPHAKCTSTERHACDFLAADAAKQLATRIQRLGSDPIVIENQVAREQVDENRFLNRNTAFHHAFQSQLNGPRESTVVIECHSFRPNQNAFGEDTSIYFVD